MLFFFSWYKFKPSYNVPRSSSTGPKGTSFLYTTIMLFDSAIGINGKSNVGASLISRI